tara:strand:- start:3187 stop:5448 length:2262 start_codon:yes stop_codon:yes gene_type:complete
MSKLLILLKMKLNNFVFILFFSFLIPSVIVGTISDEDGNPIIYANVYLKDTFDGTSSDDKGSFAFDTSESGLQTLIVSFIGYETYEAQQNVNTNLTLNIVLKELITKADEVIITAGSFGASDDEKVIVLDPIDIVTVASSRGEISGALEALPGTQPQADKEGIYVRGGDASEAKQIVDGMLIQNPYFSDVPDIPQRGRFEPFDFQGTAFSQGGYSAQYGQALSAIVDLKTWSRFGDFNANTFGITPLSLGYGRAYGNDSTVYGINIDYSNLKYFQNFNSSSDFIKSRVNFSKPPKGLELKTNYSKKFKKGIYKYLGRITDYSLGTNESEIGSGFDLNNKNVFILSTYKGELNDSWLLQLGLSYSNNENDSKIYIPDLLSIDSYDDLLQFRTVLSKKIFSKSKIKFGFHVFDQSSEFMNYTYEFNIDDSVENINFNQNNIIIDEFLSTAFTELDLRISKKFAINAGLRYENSDLLNQSSISPRFSSAIKVTKHSQISYAYGQFFQTPDMGFDLWYRQNNIDVNFNSSGLDFEKSTHNILNYEWSKKKKTIRFEIFDKKYENLITSNSDNCNFDICNNTLSNDGYGYSRGAELFWRSDQTSDGVGRDIWVAYSYLDSKRKFKQYSDEIIPSFASNHKLTFIYKNGLKLPNGAGFNSSLAITATTGYPYYDPYQELQRESDPYLSFDIGGSYLPDIDNGFMVIFFNISNPFGYRNSFGYSYVDFDSTELLEPEEKLPGSLRSVFIGCFMFFSIDKK